MPSGSPLGAALNRLFLRRAKLKGPDLLENLKQLAGPI
jgi:hypothetical protein